MSAEEASFDRVLATVLFTDIVGSTEKAAALGDAAWKELLERHHAVVRAMIGRYRGAEIDTTGDGFLATFDGPARGVRCAQAIIEALKPLGSRSVRDCTRARSRRSTGRSAASRCTSAPGSERWRDRRRSSFADGQGPRRRLRPHVRGRRRARAEGCPRPLAPLPGGVIGVNEPETRTRRPSTASTSPTRCGGGTGRPRLHHGVRIELRGRDRGASRRHVLGSPRIVLALDPVRQARVGLVRSIIETPDLEMRADDLRAVLDAVGSERAVLYGESEGGTLAAFFAATHPDA